MYAIEALGFVIGLSALATCTVSAHRHLARRSSPTAAGVADSVFLSLLLTCVLTGLALAVRYRWGSSWGAATLTPYVMSLAEGRPEPELVTEMPFLVQLHVFAAFAGAAAFPFTSSAGAALSILGRARGRLRGTPAKATPPESETVLAETDTVKHPVPLRERLPRVG
jgi:nitrate reductase gamma subunit